MVAVDLVTRSAGRLPYSEPGDDARCDFAGPGHLCDLFGTGRDVTDAAVALLAEATGFTSLRDEDGGGYIVSPDDLSDRLARVPRLDGHVVTSDCGELGADKELGMPKNTPQDSKSPSELIDQRIEDLGDWPAPGEAHPPTRPRSRPSDFVRSLGDSLGSP